MSDDSDGFVQDLQSTPVDGGNVRSVLPAWCWGLLVLLLGVAFSYWAAGHQHVQIEHAREAALGKVDAAARTELLAQLHGYDAFLRSVQTVFLSSNEVTAAEFSDTYRNLRPRKELPDLQALAYAHRELRADGEHYITTMYEPAAGNARLAGLDVVSQPGNLAALRAAADSNEAVLSSPFRLAQDMTADGSQGVTLRLPIYAPGSPPSTLAARRARIAGSLAASFDLHKLITAAISPAAGKALHIVVQDVTEGNARLLYDSHPELEKQDVSAREFVNEVHYGSRVWRFVSQPLLPRTAVPVWRQTLFLLGASMSLLLALLVWSVAGTRRRALQLGMRMSHRYRESEQRFRTLNDLLPALVLMAHPANGRILYANTVARARLGEKVDDGALLASLFEDASLQRLMREPRDKLRPNNAEAVLVSLNGDRFWATISMAMVAVGDADRLLVVASDISEQRQLTEMLGYHASHDALTELYNRREFERNVQRVLRTLEKDQRPCAVLYIDLDQFKLINDTSGHIAGDQLLSQLGLAMADQLRAGDLLARLGGDEFGVLATDTDAEAAQVLAERIRVRIEGHIYVWEQRSYTISASIGVVMLDRPGLTLAEVLSQADSACYMAKDHGRNRIHFYSEQDDETVRRRSEMEWANRLRTVLEEGRLLLDYQEVQPLQGQPEDDPHIELLLRLRDEDGRVVPPGTFLPAAERYGMVSQLDRWVIAEAITHFDALHTSGRIPGRCALNLSAATLEDDSLADYVLGLIEQHGVAPSRLCFEITETVAVRNLARAVKFIERLRGVGCQVALDDFGAGMSSFGYLKNLPVDVIKIDGSFIRDLDSDPMSRSIVDAITEIGHQRGLDVIAEWVASDAAIETLRALGVDYGQGFALHRPERVLYQRDEAGNWDA